MNTTVVDEERREHALQEAKQLDGFIKTNGYVLPEPLEVYRAAYLPGVTLSQLKDRVGREFVEDGFTSTMLGDAGGRLDCYVAHAKFESIYNRYEGSKRIVEHQDEVGSALRIKIALPTGTKVAAIEALRQEDRLRSWRDFWGSEDIQKKYTKSDDGVRRNEYGTPLPTEEEERKNNRTESEILLGSGARYRVRKVAADGYVGTDSRDGVKAVKVIDVEMEYIGGGSSDGK